MPGLLSGHFCFGAGASPPDLPNANVRDARDLLDTQIQAVVRTMGTRNTVQAEQSLQPVEDTVAVIEEFLKK